VVRVGRSTDRWSDRNASYLINSWASCVSIVLYFIALCCCCHWRKINLLYRFAFCCNNIVWKYRVGDNKESRECVGRCSVLRCVVYTVSMTSERIIETRNLAIANRSRVSCAHNKSKALVVTPWPWWHNCDVVEKCFHKRETPKFILPLLWSVATEVIQGHWKWHHSINRIRVPISVP